MDLKERIDINIVDLINRIDRLTSGNVGHAKTQLKFQIKKVGEFVTELCDSQKADTGDRQLTIPDVVQQSEQFKAIVFKMANMLAVAGKGDQAVQMHRIHNSL